MRSSAQSSARSSARSSPLSTFSSSTFRQEDIDDLFTDLKVLGQIRPSDKMATRGAQMRIESETFGQGLRRWISGEGREATSRGIKRVLSQVNAILDLAMAQAPSSSNSHILQRIYSELDNTLRGLENLRTTYEADITMAAALSVHIENTARKRAAVQEHLEQLEQQGQLDHLEQQHREHPE